ncbi:MAG: hypothetical protein KKE83_02220 [Proteobacteria bacterium]|nr:hypothetical protein [Pseudomonadota bacterium]MBU1546616.1 hypothetical protein [Pseudomonadota bacterium]MBU2618481.1 hypothetical protein [Pseudomonadota bacterium]
MCIDAGALYHQRAGIVLGKKVYLGSSGDEMGKTFLMGTLKNQLPVDFSSRKTKTSFAFAHIFSNVSG